MIDFIILGFLIKKSMSGYDIKQQMGYSTSNFIDASFGSIYPSLKRLEQKGFLQSEEVVSNGKIKKVYSITEQGKDEFLRWLKEPIKASKSSIEAALSKIFFYKNLPKEDAINLINRYIEDVTKLKENLLALKGGVGPHADNFEICTLNFGLDFYEFTINWYKNYLVNLKRELS